MNKDQIEGGLRNLRGRGRSALGAVGGRARPQAEGAYEQIAGVAQSTYGRLRDRADTLQRDGRDFADEARGRGRALRDEAYSRGHDYRREVTRRGRALARHADENRTAALALAALGAFGIGWLLGRSQ